MVSQCERNSGPELGGGKTVMQEDQVRFRDVLVTPVAERDWGHPGPIHIDSISTVLMTQFNYLGA